MLKNFTIRTPCRASVRRIPLPKGNDAYRTDRALPKPDISCATDSCVDTNLHFARVRAYTQTCLVTAVYDRALAPSGLRITQFSILRTLGRLSPFATTGLRPKPR